MLNQFLCILFQASLGPVLGFAVDSMLPVKKTAPPKWIRVGVWVVAVLFSSIYRVLGGYFPGPVNYVQCLLNIFAMIAGCRFFYDGRLLHKIAVNLILIMAIASGELTGGFALWALRIPKYSLDFTKTDMVLGLSIANLTSGIAIFFVAVLWRRFRLQKRIPRSSWVFVAMLICLLLPTLAYSMEMYVNKSVISPLYLISMTGAFILSLLLICLKFNQVEKDYAEKELSVLKHQTELERQHYESVEARREEMAKIRHDYNNHLSSVLGLIRMDKPDEAEQVIESLLAKVDATGDIPEE